MAKHAETLGRGRQDGLDLHGGGAVPIPRLEAKRQIDLAVVDLRREPLPGDVRPEPLECLTDGGARAYVSPRQPLDVYGDLVHKAHLPKKHEARDHHT